MRRYIIPFLRRRDLKLYDLPRNSYFTLAGDDSKEIFFFDHIDGLFSYCLTSTKQVVHFSATSEVNLLEH
jgi:hypothetical protein